MTVKEAIYQVIRSAGDRGARLSEVAARIEGQGWDVSRETVSYFLEEGVRAGDLKSIPAGRNTLYTI